MKLDEEGMIAILCAADSEYLNVKKYFHIIEEGIMNKIIPYAIAMLIDRQIIFIRIGVGKKNALQNTNYLLSHYPIYLLFSVGISGGLNPSLKIGDVILTHEVHWKQGSHIFNVECFYADLFVGAINNIIANLSFQNRRICLYQGALYASDHLITDDDKAAFLFESRRCLCVDTESMGIVKACKLFQVPYLGLKIISDNAGRSALQSMVTYQYRLTSILGKLLFAAFTQLNK